MRHQSKRRTRKKQLTHADRKELGKFGKFVQLVKDGMGARQAYAETYGEVLLDATSEEDAS